MSKRFSQEIKGSVRSLQQASQTKVSSKLITQHKICPAFVNSDGDIKVVYNKSK
jgi:hypothetical protein